MICFCCFPDKTPIRKSDKGLILTPLRPGSNLNPEYGIHVLIYFRRSVVK